MTFTSTSGARRALPHPWVTISGMKPRRSPRAVRLAQPLTLALLLAALSTAGCRRISWQLVATPPPQDEERAQDPAGTPEESLQLEAVDVREGHWTGGARAARPAATSAPRRQPH